MNRTLVIGSSGKIGKQLLPMLADSGIHIVAMVRDSHKLPKIKGVEVLQANLEDEFEYAFKNCNRVIFSAGSGASTGLDKTLLIDLWGARKAIDYSIQHNIQHFVMVSSRGADNPDHGPSAIKPYLVAKCFADEYLEKSGVPYTILRPGRLTDDEGGGLITTKRPTEEEMQTISRLDTAKVIVRVLQNRSCINKIYELYKGDVPINSAIT
ncbi:MAG: SDR family oxidoreductase [Candidatus Thiodiazotropha sp.]